MNASTLRLGVIGAGLIGRENINRIASEPLCEVAAIADPTPDANAYAAGKGFPYYPDYRNMPEQATLDAVIIATPNATKGSLAVPKMEWWRYGDQVGWHAPLICERLRVEQVDPLARQIRHFCRVIRGEEQPMITAADGARTLATTLAVNEAARTGRPVQL